MTDVSQEKQSPDHAEDKTSEEGQREEIELSDGDLETELAEAEARAAEYLDLAKRIQADYDNYRKRVQKEMEEFRKFATEGILLELLDILDDFERALQVEDKGEAFVEGVRKIYQNLKRLLESKGIKEIPTDGRFDPRLHDCLLTCEGDEDGKIEEVYQKGYFLGPRVLRCAKVKVTSVQKTKEGEKISIEEEGD
ncbi:MAG: molecular chaperone GrpE [Candidatus Methanomethylophilaceae archaeon]|nr:molecular chaperone GrpE [Candidatus Methanomethylophilaceae archaeon]MDI3541164.1 molecular chaperone GrpE [Candidatus Methanomethylophilaceae archaeon]HIJ00537.1 nucleotide exchange factor GrpE [Candidatus Methanomethylophilaceae archaeon]